METKREQEEEEEKETEKEKDKKKKGRRLGEEEMKKTSVAQKRSDFRRGLRARR